MARINVDDRWWADPRRRLFIKAVGDEFKADGLALHFWHLGQLSPHNDFWVPLEQVKMIDHWEDFAKCQLMVIEGEKVYMKGIGRRAEYLKNASEKGRIGGLISAMRRKEKYGTSVPTNATNLPKQTEADPSEPFGEQIEQPIPNRIDRSDTKKPKPPEAKPNKPKLYGYSYSSGSKEEKNTHFFDAEGQFEHAAQTYRRAFPNATIGGLAKERFLGQIKTQQDASDFFTAISNYQEFLTRESWRAPKTSLTTFLGSKRSGLFWRDFISFTGADSTQTEELR